VQNGVIRNDTIWDTLVFGKIQKGIGGRLKMVVTGSAPIANEVMEFTKVALGCIVMEGVHDGWL
jgi:long-chain acyl-CoA synthetase